jgi:hypothetical protein
LRFFWAAPQKSRFSFPGDLSQNWAHWIWHVLPWQVPPHEAAQLPPQVTGQLQSLSQVQELRHVQAAVGLESIPYTVP